MSEPETETPPQPAPKKKRKKWRWIFLLLLVVLLCCYQPILSRLIPFVAKRVAAHYHIRLDFALSGNFFNRLEIDRLTAIGDAKSVIVRRVKIGKLVLHYNLSALIHRRFPDIARSIKARDADIDLTIPDDHQPTDFTKNFRIGFEIPMLLGEKLDGKAINILLHYDTGDFIIRDGFVFTAPGKPGYVSISQLTIQGGPTFRNFEAAAAVVNHHAIIGNLALAPQIYIDRADLGLNPTPANAHTFAFSGRFFGGSGSVNSAISEDATRTTKLDLHLRDIALSAIRKLVPSVPAISGTVPKIDIAISGDIDHPKTWNGTANASLKSFVSSALEIDSGASLITIRNGVARFDKLEIARGKNQIASNATLQLPQKIADFPPDQIQGVADIRALDLPALVPKIKTGTLETHATFSLANRDLHLVVSGSANHLATDQFALESAVWTIDSKKHFSETKNTPPLDQLAMTVHANFQNLTAAQTVITSGTLAATLANRQLHVTTSEIAPGDNTLALTADAELPDHPRDWKTVSFHSRLDLHAPDLARIQTDPALQNAHGVLELHADIAHADGRFNGSITASGSDFKINGLAAQTLDAAIAIKDNAAQINRLQLVIDKTDTMAVSGSASLVAPFDYAGKMALHLDNLAFLNPLLKLSAIAPISGALHLDWSGTGDFANNQHTGLLAFDLLNFKSQKLAISKAVIAGHYDQDDFKFPDFHIVSGDTALGGDAEIHEGKLRLQNLLLTQKGATVLSGYAFIPFDIYHPAALFPRDQRVAANINATNLDIDKLVADLHWKSPVSGKLSASLIIGGTLYEPNGNLHLIGKSLRLKSQPKLAATDCDATLHFQQPTLTLDATLKQPDIKPLTIKGSIPLDLEKIANSGHFDLATPLAINFDLPRSSLTFLNRLSTGIRYVEGFVETHCKIGGTIKSPELSGNVLINLVALRLKQPTAPTFSNFRSELRFVNNRLQIIRCDGTISGGHLAVSGGIDFKHLLKPDLNLQVRTQNALILRNETITARADADIKIAGPIDAAKVTGSVGITKSRFFRDIDILPIQLPQRPAPKLPELTQRISVPIPLMRKWTFHVAVRTKDPFQIRSNLANGNAIINLTLLGTGLAPTLDGNITVDNLNASLPFSRLRVSHGNITFSPNDPFVPTLDIRGESTMQNYNISVYIYGSADNPKTVFSSEPPLPQEDIISLLATGATTKDLQGDSDALAGRAAALLFNKVYHTVFKNRPPPDENSLAGRFRVDVGGVDPRTGHQEIGAQFRLTHQFYLTGDLDVQSEVRGELKYIIRFR